MENSTKSTLYRLVQEAIENAGTVIKVPSAIEGSNLYSLAHAELICVSTSPAEVILHIAPCIAVRGVKLRAECYSFGDEGDHVGRLHVWKKYLPGGQDFVEIDRDEFYKIQYD